MRDCYVSKHDDPALLNVCLHDGTTANSIPVRSMQKIIPCSCIAAGRGTDETSEPQPIPAVLAGCDKDWMKLAPQSLRFWERLCLEPYAASQDVAYIVVCPDSEFILTQARGFMAELSRQYEQCRLGKHRPLTTKIRDATLRVGRSAARNLRNQAVADWFRALGSSPTAAKLKLYAQFCQGHLGKHLLTFASLQFFSISSQLLAFSN
jgi:hypothetical protein